MIGALTLTAGLAVATIPIDTPPPIVFEDLTRPLWTTAATRFVAWQWLPMYAGIINDEDSTGGTLATCRTPEAIAAGWSCAEGNPLAGGDSRAGRIAVTAGITYGMGLLLTQWENGQSRKLGKPVRLKWYHELIMASAIGGVRYAVGERNRGIEAQIRMSIGR